MGLLSKHCPFLKYATNLALFCVWRIIYNFETLYSMSDVYSKRSKIAIQQQLAIQLIIRDIEEI